MKNILITGANRCLGFEIARQAGEKDFHVFISGRDEEKLLEGAAPRPVEKEAQTPVWLASDAPQQLTGKFFRDKKQIPW